MPEDTGGHIYKILKETLILRLIRTGSHSDLF